MVLIKLSCVLKVEDSEILDDLFFPNGRGTSDSKIPWKKEVIRTVDRISVVETRLGEEAVVEIATEATIENEVDLGTERESALAHETEVTAKRRKRGAAVERKNERDLENETGTVIEKRTGETKVTAMELKRRRLLGVRSNMN